MYKIKNITRGKLLLFDLGIKLDSGETVDLDSVVPREKADLSVNLRVAEDNELIAILHKDIVKHEVAQSTFDPNMFLEMEKRIRDQIVQQMQPQSLPEVPQIPLQPVQNNDVANLTEKLAQLINKMGTQPVGGNVAEAIEMADYTPDVDKLNEVHAKALKRMTAGSTGNVEAKESTSDSEVDNRADELGDLLG